MELEAKLEKRTIKPGQKEKNHLLLRIKTPPPPTIINRQPLVIGLAIDKSWSMKGEKISATLDAAESLINWLTRHDYISIIAYSADVQMVQPLIQLKDKSAVIDKLHSIQVATSTNLSGGWLQALRAIESADVPNSYKRVILLTDGQATMGIKEQSQFNQIAADHFSRGISTTTIGFGEDFNEHSLREIALAGGGNFYYIQSPEQTNEIFFKEFGDIGALYGQALEIKLKMAPGVKMLELLHDMPVQKVSDDTITIQPGDIRSDDVRNIILGLEVSANSEVYETSLVSAELSYYNLFEKMKFDKVSASVFIRESEEEPAPDKDVVVERLVATSARTIMRAARLIQDNELTHARDSLQGIISKVESSVALSPELLKPLLSRLKVMENKLKENTGNTSKHFIMAGSEIQSRIDLVDLSGIDLHDSIFEYKTIGDIDLYKCPDIKTIVKSDE